LHRRLGEPQTRSGHGGEEKNTHSLPGLEPPIIHPVAQRYTAELCWLLVLFAKGNQIKEDKMGGSCGTHDQDTDDKIILKGILLKK
jgi:hypothetical protein